MAVELEQLSQLLTNKLKEHFGDQIVDIYEKSGELNLIIHREGVVPIMTMLRDDADFQFNYLSHVTAVDYLSQGRDVRYDVVYHLYSIPKTHRVRVKAAVPEEDLNIESVFSIWQTANFHERETFDMFGIVFKNHPDLRRILMPDDWDGHPLRKDFPLGGVKSFYFKRSTDPHAGEPKDLIPRIRVQKSDI